MFVSLTVRVISLFIAALSPVARAQVSADAVAIVANYVRVQGLRCEKPSAVERDSSLSKPGLPVWILTCDEHRYRVELIPHKQARVTPLD